MMVEERERVVSLRRALVGRRCLLHRSAGPVPGVDEPIPWGPCAPPLRWIARVLREEGLPEAPWPGRPRGRWVRGNPQATRGGHASP
ncbi:MAG: hypothetical protein HW395_630 [candidate division NC10 bacterium]|jgi:hypothetical protein|nr:hypothetical protein [candidate division NC10 bacterium]